jgi:hypothetical protein
MASQLDVDSQNVDPAAEVFSLLADIVDKVTACRRARG